MIYGLKFSNIHSSVFHLFIKSKVISLPAKSKRKMIIAGKNGSWDFGGETYEDRLITVNFEVMASNKTLLRLYARDIAAWLSGSGQLILDEEIDKYYTAKVFAGISPEEVMNDGSFTVTFECKPFANLIYQSNEITDLNKDLLIYSNLRLDDKFEFSIDEPSNIEVNNFGTVPVRPLISVTGSFTTFGVTINGKTLNYTQAISNSSIVIDNENYTVKKGSENKLGITTGNLNTFLELPPGVNTVNISGTGLSCTVLFIFRAMFL